jgi:hypothetical protein
MQASSPRQWLSLPIQYPTKDLSLSRLIVISAQSPPSILPPEASLLGPLEIGTPSPTNPKP